MLYILYCTLSVLACCNFHTVFSIPVSYDQRQNGDVNVQIHLKDVQVVALLGSELLEDYEDYDYAYDYADFTIKPISKPTTSSSSESTSTTVKPWTTWPTNPPKNATASIITTTITTASDSPSSVSSNSEITTISTINNEATESNNDSFEANSTIYNLGNIHEINETEVKLPIKDKIEIPLVKKAINVDLEKQPIAIFQTSESTKQGNSKKLCPTGYTLSTKGHCRAIRHRFSLMPLPELKLRSKLSNKNHAPLTKDLPIRLYKAAIRQ